MRDIVSPARGRKPNQTGPASDAKQGAGERRVRSRRRSGNLDAAARPAGFRIGGVHRGKKAADPDPGKRIHHWPVARAGTRSLSASWAASVARNRLHRHCRRSARQPSHHGQRAVPRHHDAPHRPDPGRGGGKEIVLADILSEQGKYDDAGGDAAVASECLCLERTRQRRMIGDAPRPCRSACPSAEAASMMSGGRGAVGPSAGSETTIPSRP